MPTMTLSVPDDLYAVIKHHNEIKWSVIARNAMFIKKKAKLTSKDLKYVMQKIS